MKKLLLLITLFCAIFSVCKAWGGVSPKTNAGANQRNVNVSGAAANSERLIDGGTMVGRRNSKGQVVYDNSVQGTRETSVSGGGLTDDKSIKAFQNGNPNQHLVFDQHNKAWPMSTDSNGNVCYDPQTSFNKGNIPYGFDVPFCASGPDDAMLKASQMLNNACSKEKEEMMCLVRKGDSYILKRCDKGDGSQKEVRGTVAINKGEELVATIHNHPELKGQSDSLWPSEEDVVSALKPGTMCDAYIRDCKTGKLAMFNHEDGEVYEIAENSERKPLKRDFPNHIRQNDGHDPYQFENLELLRRKAADSVGKDVDVGASVENIKIPDLSKLVDLVKQTVEQLRKINAMSQKPSAADYAGYNGLSARAMAEVKAIEDEIGRMNLTEDEKNKLGEELGKQMREKVMPYCDTIASLKRQIEAKGYGRFHESNFNFDPKYLK